MLSMVDDAHEYLRAGLEALQRAFPDGVQEEDYLPLLAALDEYYSNRNLAWVVATLTGRHPIDVDNDHARAMSLAKPPSDAVDAMRERVLGAGFKPDDE